MAYRQVNCQSQMLELVEAQTRLAEAQLAVLQMRNTILNSQVIVFYIVNLCGQNVVLQVRIGTGIQLMSTTMRCS